MKSNPKKFNLQEVWEMYKLLEMFLPDDLSITMLDAVEYIISKIDEDTLFNAMVMAYPENEFEGANGLDVLLLLVKCFKVNDFFFFVEFVRSAKW